MRKLGLLAKIAVTFGIALIVIKSLNIDAIAHKLVNVHIPVLLLSLIVFTAQILILGYRWVLVIRCLDGHLPVSRGLSITFIAQFFSQVLPSSVGGDGVRIWLASRNGVGLRQAFFSVIDDRIVATAMLLVLIIFSVPLQLQVLPADAAVWSTDIVVAGCLAGLALVLICAPLLRRRLSRPRLVREGLDWALSLHRVFLHRQLSLGMIVMSLVNHVLSILGMMLLAQSLSLHTTWAAYWVLVPLIMLMTMIPLSIGGWGVREGAMVVGFGFVGMSGENAVALSVLFGLATAAVSLPGGVLWGVGRAGLGSRDLGRRWTSVPSSFVGAETVDDTRDLRAVSR